MKHDYLDNRPLARKQTVCVNVGGVRVGGEHPIVVQSMTNTDTGDVDASVEQIEALHRAGSEIVRITVDRDEAAKAVPQIKERLLARDIDVPLTGKVERGGIVRAVGVLVVG